ncbi:hypothetical protein GW813_14785 [bacterium]|nr:hypothetical protein [bacterium]PIU95058.1 MAG: hypothetical protein COS65_04420 [Armatimonadetes bacterium CG06_land_8_20_14_3_00_66_21]PIZ42889.1 MAG: hypothetical protein COY42_16775 [Armatimonadetes bacterium CG_4_10_14_0_8_um_filter_66_14]
MVKTALDRRQLPWGYRFEHFLALMLPVLWLSLLVGHYAPGAFSVVILVDLFLVALFLAVTQCIKYFDDEYTDVAGVLLGCFLIGPLITMMVYSLVGLIRGEQNGSLLTLMGAYFVTTLVMMLALQGIHGGMDLVLMMQVGLVMKMLSLCAVFSGWFLSGFWRPLNA